MQTRDHVAQSDRFVFLLRICLYSVTSFDFLIHVELKVSAFRRTQKETESDRVSAARWPKIGSRTRFDYFDRSFGATV
jgi:hypothetical protein